MTVNPADEQSIRMACPFFYCEKVDAGHHTTRNKVVAQRVEFESWQLRLFADEFKSPSRGARALTAFGFCAGENCVGVCRSLVAKLFQKRLELWIKIHNDMLRIFSRPSEVNLASVPVDIAPA